MCENVPKIAIFGGRGQKRKISILPFFLFLKVRITNVPSVFSCGASWGREVKKTKFANEWKKKLKLRLMVKKQSYGVF